MSDDGTGLLRALELIYTLHAKIGLTNAQVGDLCELLDKTPKQIHEMFEDAGRTWLRTLERLTSSLPPPPLARPVPENGAQEVVEASPFVPHKDLPKEYTSKTFELAKESVRALSSKQIEMVRRRYQTAPNGGSLALDVCRAICVLLSGVSEKEALASGVSAEALVRLASRGHGSSSLRYPERIYPWLFQNHAWPYLVTEKLLKQLQVRASSPRQRERLRLVELSYTGASSGKTSWRRHIRVAEQRCLVVGAEAYVLHG